MADPYRQLRKDFVSGTAGGITQVLIGQGPDIIKVRLQTQSPDNPRYRGTFDCARQIYQNEGILAFYKGTLTPLLGIGLCVSIQFWTFHSARRALEDWNIARRPDRRRELSYPQFYAAGATAGVSNSLIAGPVEHIRIRLQTQPHGGVDSRPRLYNGPLDCILKITRNNGIMRGLYRGQFITILREAQGYGVWFLTYEYLMNHARRAGVRREDIPTWKLLTFGAIAGEALWLASYPLDVIKSRLQSDGFGPGQMYKGTLDCFRKTWAQGGMGAFWKGIVPTVLRATPCSAGTFATVELMMRLLG